MNNSQIRMRQSKDHTEGKNAGSTVISKKGRNVRRKKAGTDGTEGKEGKEGKEKENRDK